MPPSCPLRMPDSAPCGWPPRQTLHPAEAGDDETLVSGQLSRLLGRTPLGARHDSGLDELRAVEILRDLLSGPPCAPAERLQHHLFQRRGIGISQRAEMRDEQAAA